MAHFVAAYLFPGYPSSRPDTARSPVIPKLAYLRLPINRTRIG